jgi:hypothetical protein
MFVLRPFETTGRFSIVSAALTTRSFAGILKPHPRQLVA